MAIELEKVVQKFYDNLEEGKITGKKCTKCGAVEFPPVYACNSCGCSARPKCTPSSCPRR